MRMFRLVDLTINDVRWEALVATKPNSFKLDLWAAPIDPIRYELKYLGTIGGIELAATDEELSWMQLEVEAKEFITKQLDKKSN